MESKKNWTMRAAGLMLALVLITSCFVGGTFAKYVTSGSGKSTARVAKFGVTVTASGDMFAKQYDAADPNLKDHTGAVIAQTVISSDDSNVVAPGTSSTDAVVSKVSGTPEVAVAVKHEATVDLNNQWVDKDNNYYCPLRITVGNEEVYGMDFENAAAFAAAVKGKIDSEKNYKPNADLSDEGVASPSVSWKWDFEGNDGKQTNEKDTFLGDKAAKGEAATITITIATTVTQID